MKINILNYTENPLDVIGINASICYNTKLKDDKHAERIAKNCLKSGHGRNMEFARVTVAVSEVSARMAREFYTSIGGSPTRLQASTRYITYNDFGYYTPQGMNEEQLQVYKETMQHIQDGYGKLKDLGCKNDITGYVLPLGMETTFVFEMNARTLESLFNQRLCSRALLEYQLFARELKNEISKLDNQWRWIADNFFICKCEKTGVCLEEKSCGKYNNINK